MRKLINFALSQMAVSLNDFKYHLPEDRIATHPLPVRDESKLLVYQDSHISHRQFFRLTDYLPNNAFLFFNDTKVIPARLFFTKETGAIIEVFLLSPVFPSPDVSTAMTSTGTCTWKCTIGNAKRWTGNAVLKKTTSVGIMSAQLLDKEKGLVEFSWESGASFAEIINELGVPPLPPYLKREVEASDKERYQTIYSHHEGAVAAPTAGLHFTDRVFTSLRERGIDHDFVTLHVSAGTFQPIKTENIEDHVMHHEQIVITRKNVDNLLHPDRHIVAVGTTSMRTLESLYWFGVKLLANPKGTFEIGQHDPYQPTKSPSTQEALAAVRNKMIDSGIDQISGTTGILIKPGYEFKVCHGLITNFHQPGSTLMLLVAAFVGEDWKKIYEEALNNNYRFLSFGDSSLLLP